MVSHMPPRRIALVYALFGSLWILLSDRLVGSWIADSASSAAQTAKGLVFIAVTTLLVYTLARRGQRELRESEARQRALVAASPLGLVSLDLDGHVLTWNESAEHIFGWSRDEVEGRMLPFVPPEKHEEFADLRARVAAGESFTGLELERRRKDGSTVPISLSTAPILGEAGQVVGIMAAVEDITERRRATAEREELEGQLFQARKMEAIGRLAGGLAHDFNNMLTVIIGHVDMALEAGSLDDATRDDLEQVGHAAQQSSDLIRQLLSFARKQVIAPRVLDLNEAVAARIGMLARLIGENVRLVWQPAPDLWPVRLDPAQLDQLLTNLLVNARDAIDDIGEVTVETVNAEFDEAYCADHVGFLPGHYACLVVSDTGVGMDRDTVANIFEPFFSTKAPEQGTGLGLATVYGIVRQNDGFINVYSEPGEGTTFRVYLPRALSVDPESAESGPEAERESNAGAETILLVEDEPALLRLATRILERLGYHVLAAAGPEQAIELSAGHEGPIDLLLTDVVMPHMNGRDLHVALCETRPGLGCLFMSGYTANVIVTRGVLAPGVRFLQKPFSAEALGHAVREALDADG